MEGVAVEGLRSLIAVWGPPGVIIILLVIGLVWQTKRREDCQAEKYLMFEKLLESKTTSNKALESNTLAITGIEKTMDARTAAILTLERTIANLERGMADLTKLHEFKLRELENKDERMQEAQKEFGRKVEELTRLINTISQQVGSLSGRGA